MAKKKVVHHKKKQAHWSDIWHKYKVYIVPSAIGGVVAWWFAGNLNLGILIFIAVWAGNWVAREVLEKKTA